MAWRLRHFGNEEQGQAVAALQHQVWKLVIERFEALRDEAGLRQSDLARSLGVSRPQIHEWLSDPANMTIKAAGRLMLAMDGDFDMAMRPATDRSRRSGPAARAPSRTLLALAAAVGACLTVVAPLETEAQAAPLKLEALSGAAAPRLSGAPTILVFWRADCGPCLIELKGLAAMEAAAAPTRLAVVSLDTASVARDRLASLKVAPRFSWRLRDDPAATLVALGGPPPRLPLSVAFDAAGRVCGRRTGLLGLQTIKQWATSCSR